MIDPELRERAESLYVIDDLTFDEVSEATGIHMRTIQGWSAREGWPEQRRKHRADLREIERKTVLLRKALIEKAFDSLDPQHVYAAARLEGLARGKDKRPDEKTTDIDRPRIFLEDMEFIAEVLKEVDPEALKAFAGNFELIVNRFKEKHEKTT